VEFSCPCLFGQALFGVPHFFFALVDLVDVCLEDIALTASLLGAQEAFLAAALPTLGLDPVWALPTTLTDPEPGTRLVSSPVDHRIRSMLPLTAVTTPSEVAVRPCWAAPSPCRLLKASRSP
jgi:hypothetical protein